MLFQATSVAIGNRAVLITGSAGTGKSSLALALIDRGAVLVGDDGVSLTVCGNWLRASPAPLTAGLLEIRNLGIVPFPHTADVPVAVVLHLDPAAPRYIEAASQFEVLGLSLPLVALWPDSPALHLRAEQALLRYGLT